MSMRVLSFRSGAGSLRFVTAALLCVVAHAALSQSVVESCEKSPRLIIDRILTDSSRRDLDTRACAVSDMPVASYFDQDDVTDVRVSTRVPGVVAAVHSIKDADASGATLIETIIPVVRPEDIPTLSGLYHRSMPQTRLAIRKGVVWLTRTNDRHRETVADLVLAEEPSSDPSRRHLSRLLSRYMDGRVEDDLLPWMMRWLRDTGPIESDRAVLLKLATQLSERVSEPRSHPSFSFARWAVFEALSKLGGKEAIDFLSTKANRGAHDAMAQAALVKSGVVSAIDALARDALGDPEPLAFLAEVAPHRALDMMNALCADGKPSEIDGLISMWREASEEVIPLYGLSPAIRGGLSGVAIAKLTSSQLLDSMMFVPSCNDVRSANVVIGRLERGDSLLSICAPGYSDNARRCAMLEVCFGKRFVSILRREASKSGDGAGAANACLLLLGDGDSAPTILGWVAAGGSFSSAGMGSGEVRATLCLAALLGSSRIHQALVDAMDGRRQFVGSNREDIAVALACARGVPITLAHQIASLASGADRDVTLLALANGRLELDRLATAWGATTFIAEAGSVKNDAAVRYLSSLLTSPTKSARRWAVGELAVAGDARARCTLENAFNNGRLEWCDGASLRHWLSVGVEQALSIWMKEMENPSRVVTSGVGSIFEKLFPIELEWLEGQTGMTAAGRVRASLSQSKYWSFSRILRKYVAEPRGCR
jgi:hypothetical protein